MSFAEDFGYDIFDIGGFSAPFSHISINDKTWTTKDGKEIPIHEMDTTHIENTIKLLKKYDAEVPSEMEKVLYCRKIKEK